MQLAASQTSTLPRKLLTSPDAALRRDGAVLHTDSRFPLTIGRSCTVGHKTIVHGCTVGDYCLIGMGAVVMDGAVIGEGCLIGAGALIPPGKVIPPRSLVKGVGKVVRQLSDEEVEFNKLSAAMYVGNQQEFALKLSKL